MVVYNDEGLRYFRLLRYAKLLMGLFRSSWWYWVMSVRLLWWKLVSNDDENLLLYTVDSGVYLCIRAILSNDVSSRIEN